MRRAIFNTKDRTVTGLEVFRAGDYGERGSFTAEDLKEIAESYSENILPAAFNLDHEQGGPALGWVTRVYADGDSLFADAKDVHPDVFGAFQKGTLKTRSAEIYNDLPDAGGKKYLGGVALLGAARPKVKGMSNEFRFEYREDIGETPERPNGQIVYVDLEDPLVFHEQKPAEKPKQKRPQEVIIMAEAELKDAPEGTKVVDHSAQISELQAKLDAAEKARTEAEAKQEALNKQFAEQRAQLDAEREQAEFDKFWDKAASAGKVLPPHKSLFRAAHKAAWGKSDPIKFSDETAEGGAFEVTPSRMFSEFLANAPKVVPGDAFDSKTLAKFAEKNDRGMSDEDKMDKEARAYMKENGCTYKEALMAVSKGAK